MTQTEAARVFAAHRSAGNRWCRAAGPGVLPVCTPGSRRLDSPVMADVTQLLTAAEAGDPRAAAELLPLVYDELRKLAAARLAEERPGQTLQPTALVHEAYLRLVGGGQPDGWNGRGHFFAAAAEAMRRIVVEAARRKGRMKHGGGRERVEVELADLPTRLPSDDLLALDEALGRLEQLDPVKARLVSLRFFAGMTIEQAAEALGISRVTAHRYWTFARAWLHLQMTGGGPG
jgi:RNA polymerase sigma factor (TIGR02999 family)